MYYGRYKKVRNASWNCLLDCGIGQLPVKVGTVAARYDFALCSYSRNEVLIRSLGLGGLLTAKGFSTMAEGRGMIFYDDRLPISEQRFTIAHELGHLLLGHTLPVEGGDYYPDSAPDYDPRREETAADGFAQRLLAPACVLHALSMHAPSDIATVSGLPFPQAEQRAQRMQRLYRREQRLQADGKASCFLMAELECAVLEQFQPWIRGVG